MVEINAGIKSLVGKKLTKKVKFLNEDVTITKLTVAQVKQMQSAAKEVESEDADDEAGFDMLKTIIASSVEGGNQLSDDDFENFPMDELSKLSGDIMKFSGLSAEKAGK